MALLKYVALGLLVFTAFVLIRSPIVMQADLDSSDVANAVEIFVRRETARYLSDISEVNRSSGYYDCRIQIESCTFNSSEDADEARTPSDLAGRHIGAMRYLDSSSGALLSMLRLFEPTRLETQMVLNGFVVSYGELIELVSDLEAPERERFLGGLSASDRDALTARLLRYQSENVAVLREMSALSQDELAEKYRSGDGAARSEIIEYLERRDQRQTKVAGEFFPDMKEGDEHNAFVTLARATTAQPRALFSQAATGRMDATLEPVAIDETTKTTAEVGAQLIGANFDIEPIDMQWRTIPDGSEDSFAWTVVPNAEGARQLIVILRQRIQLGDEVIEIPVDEFPKVINVSVGFWTRIGRLVAGAETAAGTASTIGASIAGIFGFASLGGVVAWLVRQRRGPALSVDRNYN